MATNQPLPEKRYNLYYRGKLLKQGETMGTCVGERIALMKTGCYLKFHFDIKPYTNGK